jgi:hypothetical protein
MSDHNCNSFVTYLNTLQRLDGNNENALAESQACNPDFSSIYVSHPLAQIIYNDLQSDDRYHVILTGHAGDGKSTIALEVFKQLKSLPDQLPLSRPLSEREDIGSISIIKDFSERNKKDDESLLQELKENKNRFLIVSNTGTLLDFVKSRANQLEQSISELEDQVLTAIGKSTGVDEVKIGGVHLRIYNLSQIDNLSLAKSIFDKMLTSPRWDGCQKCICKESCPVKMNVDLLTDNPIVVDRMFLIYRRMHEYGIRFTMRQFTEHMSFVITAGLMPNELIKISEQGPENIYPQYLFYNTFFGDDGMNVYTNANEIKAVQEIRKQGFGSRPSPSWEHKLWLLGANDAPPLEAVTLSVVYEKMLKNGKRKNIPLTVNDTDIDPRASREQVRRMLFFLNNFEISNNDYISQYLNSAKLLSWLQWQDDAYEFSYSEKERLKNKIYHVLQEHFSRVRIPEKTQFVENKLYITLNRKRKEVRQSAQVVLAQLDWESSVELKLIQSKDICGNKRNDLFLEGKGSIDGINLSLRVPFLDFVMMRHTGELGEVLQASYIERLDRYKAEIHNKTKFDNNGEIMLVRLKTDHTFRRQHFIIKKDSLEVSNAI